MKQTSSSEVYQLKRPPKPQSQEQRLNWIAWKKRRPTPCPAVCASGQEKGRRSWAQDIRCTLVPPDRLACPQSELFREPTWHGCSQRSAPWASRSQTGKQRLARERQRKEIRPRMLGSSVSSAPHWLSNLSQITFPLWVSVSPSVKGRH